MAEAGRPSESTPLAADDMIGSLATRVRELSLRVAELEGQLEAARKRVAVYEDFDTQVQDSLTAALRAANQIRERAKVSAEAIAQEARAQRPADTRELEAVRIERDALRRAIESASTSTPGRGVAVAPAAVFQMSEMRTAATEALRGVFKELVAEIRSLPVDASGGTSSAVPAAVSPRPANSPSPSAQPSAAVVPAAQLPVSVTPPPAPYVAPAPAPTPAPQPTYVAPAQPTYVAPAAPRPVVVPQPQPSAVVEDVDVAPAAATPAPVTQAPPPAPAAATAPHAVPPQAREEWVTPTEPIGEVQVVLSPISSFPRLVELERRLQGMPAVRTVYARDFRNGVATLAIGLRNPMTVDEFAAAVTRLEYPRLKVVSTTGYVLELRIDSEASSIA